MKEACGVFGVYAPGVEVAPLVFDGIFALQHRGQESAGMAVTDGSTVTVVKDMGLVSSVFDARTLSSLEGHLGLGHVRYSTAGPSTWHNAQPVFRSVGEAGFALGHNGNLTNVEELLESAGMLPGFFTNDSDLIAELLSREFPPEPPRWAATAGAAPEGGWEHLAVRADRDEGGPGDLERALLRVLPSLKGAFSLGLLDAHHLMAVRDPNGFRPLCLGRLDAPGGAPTGGWVVASESPALDIVGATFVREIEPGEMVVIDANGPRSVHPFPAARVDPKLCVFEFVYFARPDAHLYGREVHAARRRMGEQLAEEAPVIADLVIGVPDSGVPAAEGFAAASGIPFGQGLVKNRYIGRTFIAPTEQARADGVRRKLNPLRESIEGLRLVVVDDSIVRGTTTRQIVGLLRDAGAAEVHIRVSSPPFAWPCFYGIDTPSRAELLAARLSGAEIAGHLGADSAEFLSLDRLLAAIGAGSQGFCSACLTGAYPTQLPHSLGELAGSVPERP